MIFKNPVNGRWWVRLSPVPLVRDWQETISLVIQPIYSIHWMHSYLHLSPEMIFLSLFSAIYSLSFSKCSLIWFYSSYFTSIAVFWWSMWLYSVSLGDVCSYVFFSVSLGELSNVFFSVSLGELSSYVFSLYLWEN